VIVLVFALSFRRKALIVDGLFTGSLFGGFGLVHGTAEGPGTPIGDNE